MERDWQIQLLQPHHIHRQIFWRCSWKRFKYCISQTLTTAAESTQDWNWAMSHPCFCLQIPTALDGSKTNTVSPFSMSSFVPWSLCPDGTTFWQEYEKRRGSKNGIENGLMLLMDVETFENAHYPQWDIFASTPSMCPLNLLAPHICATGRRTVWSWLSPETWNNRWLGRVAFHISFQKLFATVSLSFLSFQIISYNHIKVGQSGTFVEPGSANLISFSVQIISLGLNLKWHAIIFLQPFWSLFPSQGVWDKYDRQGSGKLWTGRQWKPNWRNQNLLCGTICSSSLYNQVLVKFKSQDNNDRLEFDLEYFNKVLGACLSTCSTF